MPDLDLLDRRGRERDPDRVADALAEQRAEGDGGLDGALERRSGLGDAEVQRVVARLAEQLVRPDHDHRVVVLDEILKSRKPCSSNRLASHSADSTSASGVALPYLASSRLSSEPALTPIRIEVPRSRGRRGDLLHLVVEGADVARVDPDGRAAGVDRGEDVLGLEVDVGDHRDLRLVRDRRQRVGVVLARHRDPHDVAAGGGQLGDLLQRGVDVRGQRRGHRLHADRGVAADRRPCRP